MPWGWECHAKFVKQIPAKPTQRRGKRTGKSPAPNKYEIPQIFCGRGYSKIKRAPAYTFGILPKQHYDKVSKSPMPNTCGMSPKGPYKIKHGVVTPELKLPEDNMKTPGPGAYSPGKHYHRPPAFSIRPAARPPYEPWDQWSPAPNMYLPYKPTKRAPAYSFSDIEKKLTQPPMPCPGEYDPKFNYVDKTKPAYSFGAPFKTLRRQKIPAPNAYCENKFMYAKPSIPAPSFGIRHTKYLGKQAEYLLPPDFGITITGE